MGRTKTEEDDTRRAGFNRRADVNHKPAEDHSQYEVSSHPRTILGIP